jgi:hypothetical protein
MPRRSTRRRPSRAPPRLGAKNDPTFVNPIYARAVEAKSTAEAVDRHLELPTAHARPFRTRFGIEVAAMRPRFRRGSAPTPIPAGCAPPSAQGAQRAFASPFSAAIVCCSCTIRRSSGYSGCPRSCSPLGHTSRKSPRCASLLHGDAPAAMNTEMTLGINLREPD